MRGRYPPGPGATLKLCDAATDKEYSENWSDQMRVTDWNPAGSAATEAGHTQDVQKSDRAEGTRSGNALSTSDSVEFSAALGGLSRAVSADSAQRNSRVQAVAAVYQNGTYRPDPVAISRGMISDAIASGQFNK